MTDKDPKDMTASELLRWAGNGDEFISPIDGNSWTTYSGKLKSFVEWESGDWPNDARLCDCLADKIDAELAQARNESLLQGAQVWAKANGWPDFREGEDFGTWLDRCALPRPRFEDGEVVGVREYEDIQGYCVYDDGEFFVATPNRSIDYAAGERVERPAPEVLGADGKPIVEGETVWWIFSGIEGTVSSVNNDSTAYVKWDDGRLSPCIDCCNLTHTPPETQERIDDDATMPPREYYNARIGHDVGLKDDEEVAVAMVRDLLRRQRELDKRTGGE